MIIQDLCIRKRDRCINEILILNKNTKFDIWPAAFNNSTNKTETTFYFIDKFNDICYYTNNGKQGRPCGVF